MQPFDDIFHAPPDGSMSNNERGLFIPLDMKAISMIKDELFHIVIQCDPVYDVITFPPPIAVCCGGAIRRMGSIAVSIPTFEKFLSENPDLWILHTSRNMSGGIYYATTELNSHLPIRIAEDKRRKARGCMYKIMIHWTLDMLHTLAHRAGVAMSSCVGLACINALQTPSGDSTYFMTDILVWLADNDGQGKFISTEAAYAGYKLTRSMFTLMRARLIVMLCPLTRQKDTARMIICMAYPR